MAEPVEQHVEGRFTGARDVELYWQGSVPPEPTGVLLVSHGLGEHSGRYGNVVDALLPDGWAVYGLDHRGHGRSGGRRAHLDAYAYPAADLAGATVLCCDHATFLNHGHDPNTVERPFASVAARPIAAGEEITCDYGAFCVGWTGLPG